MNKQTSRCEKEYTESLKPFVKWVGGKNKLLNDLVNLLPTRADNGRVPTKYCEPMVGGGALLFYLLSNYDFKQFYISDINTELINAYQVLKENIDSLIEKLREMRLFYCSMDENDRKLYYYSIRDKFNNTQLNDTTAVKKAAYFIFLNKTCFNGVYRVNRKGQFNVPIGAYKNPSIYSESNLRNINKALQNVTIICGDYSLSKQFIDQNTFVYLDPPYRPISKTSDFTSYNADAFNDCEQIRLAKYIDEINASGAKFVLSNSDPKNVNPEDTFFDELYKEYRIKRVSVARMINSKSDSRGKISELLIYN